MARSPAFIMARAHLAAPVSREGTWGLPASFVVMPQKWQTAESPTYTNEWAQTPLIRLRLACHTHPRDRSRTSGHFYYTQIQCQHEYSLPPPSIFTAIVKGSVLYYCSQSICCAASFLQLTPRGPRLNRSTLGHQPPNALHSVCLHRSTLQSSSPVW